MNLTTSAISIVPLTCFSALGVIVLLAAALHDVAFRTIPNWMPATLLLLGSVLRMLDGSLPLGLLASAFVLLGTGMCWRRGWLGGGDVKLLAACGLLVPPGLALAMLMDVALAGGMLALLYLAAERTLTELQGICPTGLLGRIVRVERHRIHRRRPLPYAFAIAAGALLVLLKGP